MIWSWKIWATSTSTKRNRVHIPWDILYIHMAYCRDLLSNVSLRRPASIRNDIDGLVQDCNNSIALSNGVTAVLHWAIDMQYMQRIMHTGQPLLCLVRVPFYPYPSGLLHRHGSHAMIATVPIGTTLKDRAKYLINPFADLHIAKTKQDIT